MLPLQMERCGWGEEPSLGGELRCGLRSAAPPRRDHLNDRTELIAFFRRQVDVGEDVSNRLERVIPRAELHDG